LGRGDGERRDVGKGWGDGERWSFGEGWPGVREWRGFWKRWGIDHPVRRGTSA